MKNVRTPRLLSASVILLVVAIALMAVSQIKVVPPPAGPTESILVLPSPAWDSFPTRVPSPTPTSAADEPLHAAQGALLRGDPESAEGAWKTALALVTEDNPQRGFIIREGARIALARNDLDAAEARIWDAIRIQAQDAETWALLGTILARRGDTRVAEQALAVAETLDPALAPDLFTDRWLAARRTAAGDTMMTLAQLYSSQQPESPLAFYYRGAALLVSGDAESTIDQLVAVLNTQPEAPAVLWFTLGEAYLAQHAYTQTLTVLDVAGARFAMGDSSLYLASDDPARDLSLHRARAYLGLDTPARCAEAEPILQRWDAPAEAISQSVRCQTPTPTMTPWIPSQQVTPTPAP